VLVGAPSSVLGIRSSAARYPLAGACATNSDALVVERLYSQYSRHGRRDGQREIGLWVREGKRRTRKKGQMRRILHMMVEFRNVVVVGAVIGGCLGAASVALAVNAASGAWGYTPSIDGHVYKGRSTINTEEPGSPSDWAAASIYPTDGSTIPSGWMAADARKYKNGLALRAVRL
jgi:hypothetical protein